MKKLLVLIALLIISTNTFGFNNPNNNIVQICQLALKCKVYKTQSVIPKKTIFELILLNNQATPSSVVYSDEAEYQPLEDDVKWGVFSKKSAITFVSRHINIQQNYEEYGGISSQIGNAIIELISTIKDDRVIFGFTSNTGGSLCGVSMPGLLIIDQESQFVYDLSFFGKPTC